MTLWRTAEREMTALVGMVRDLSVALRPPGLDFFRSRRTSSAPGWSA